MLKLLFAVGVMFIAAGCQSNNQSEYRHMISQSNENVIFQSGNISVYKITVDSTDYLVAEQYRGGISIIPVKK